MEPILATLYVLRRADGCYYTNQGGAQMPDITMWDPNPYNAKQWASPVWGEELIGKLADWGYDVTGAEVIENPTPIPDIANMYGKITLESPE